MIRLATLILTLCVTLGLAACRDHGVPVSDHDRQGAARPPATPGSSHDGWSTDALETAQGLAAAVSAGGFACSDHTPYDYASIAASHGNRLPMPAAMSSCVGPAEEDITFEVFTDEVARDNFVASKLYVLCRAAGKKGLPAPQLPYVEGPAWLVEPDEESSADRLAKILGGASKRGSCPDARVASTSASP